MPLNNKLASICFFMRIWLDVFFVLWFNRVILSVFRVLMSIFTIKDTKDIKWI